MRGRAMDGRLTHVLLALVVGTTHGCNDCSSGEVPPLPPAPPPLVSPPASGGGFGTFVLLLVGVLLVSGILGVQFFGGVLRHRCATDAEAAAAASVLQLGTAQETLR